VGTKGLLVFANFYTACCNACAKAAKNFTFTSCGKKTFVSDEIGLKLFEEYEAA